MVSFNDLIAYVKSMCYKTKLSDSTSEDERKSSDAANDAILKLKETFTSYVIEDLQAVEFTFISYPSVSS